MMYFSNQQLYHHNPYQQCSINIENVKLQNVTSISDVQYQEVLPHNVDSSAHLTILSNIEQPLSHLEIVESVKQKKTAPKKVKLQTANSGNKNNPKKPVVDTSTFSIEERLVAAVWVHERKYTSSTISEIKHDFRRRFGRDPPSKTTLFAWERKLFSTGNVCDAPRSGRPINRKSHWSAVAASVRAAPALSLRERARALRLPRSTLHHILQHDLPRPHLHHRTPPGPAKPAPKRRPKPPSRRPLPPPPPPPPIHTHYGLNPHTHP